MDIGRELEIVIVVPREVPAPPAAPQVPERERSLPAPERERETEKVPQ